MNVYIYIYIYPRSMVVKPSVKHPHYSECSVCPPIYIHIPPQPYSVPPTIEDLPPCSPVAPRYPLARRHMPMSTSKLAGPD
jgi:hypothetical protein